MIVSSNDIKIPKLFCEVMRVEFGEKRRFFKVNRVRDV